MAEAAAATTAAVVVAVAAVVVVGAVRIKGVFSIDPGRLPDVRLLGHSTGGVGKEDDALAAPAVVVGEEGGVDRSKVLTGETVLVVESVVVGLVWMGVND